MKAIIEFNEDISKEEIKDWLASIIEKDGTKSGLIIDECEKNIDKCEKNISKKCPSGKCGTFENLKDVHFQKVKKDFAILTNEQREEIFKEYLFLFYYANSTVLIRGNSYKQ